MSYALRAVNLSVPEEVDAELTKEVLHKYNVQAAGSLVGGTDTTGHSVRCALLSPRRHHEGHV